MREKKEHWRASRQWHPRQERVHKNKHGPSDARPAEYACCCFALTRSLRDHPLQRERVKNHALKDEPQPQDEVAFGLLNTKPRPITSSRKSIVVPAR